MVGRRREGQGREETTHLAHAALIVVHCAHDAGHVLDEGADHARVVLRASRLREGVEELGDVRHDGALVGLLDAYEVLDVEE